MNSLFTLVSFLTILIIKFSSCEDNLEKIKFSKLVYKFKLNENDQINTLVGKLEYLKSIQNLNFNLIFNSTYEPSAQLFRIDYNTLEIRLNQQLPTDKTKIKPEHYLNVYLIDRFSLKRIAKCSVHIQIMSNLNTHPIFLMNSYQAQIYENNAPDTLVVKVEAFDNDFGQNSRLTYHLITNDSSNPFQIKSDTGEIYARRVLNRELKDLYALTVLAIDNGSNRLSTTTQVLIRVLAQRDFQPELDSKIYNLTLPENTDFTKKPIILKVNGTDKHLNDSSLIYSLSGSLNDLNTFEIDFKTGSIRLVSKLNYELKNIYKFNIIARDLAQPTSAIYSQLNILIKSINLNSLTFSLPFYEFILYEYSDIGSVVGRIISFDKFNSNVTYSFDFSSINSDLNDKFPFMIDPLNGTIYTIKKLSKYLRNSYEFYVNASTNSASSSVKVKVKILDINEQVPEFSKRIYQLNISEEVAIGLPLLTLNVINKDLNSLLDYSIEPNSLETNDMFTLIKQTNNKVFLTLEKTNLNYKKRSFYDLSIKVIDQDGLYSVSQVHINVMPNNKYSPRFTKDIYTFQINENLPIGSVVGSVLAVGSSQESQIIYKLITNTDQFSSNLLDLTTDFKLDELNGNIYVSNQLDREKYESITLYITASYREKSSRTDHAIIQIQILDSNDNPPLFTRQFYQANLYLNYKKGFNLMRIEAIDKDTGLNGAIKYSIECDFLTINSFSGTIRLSNDVSDYLNDKSLEEMNVTIRASDSGIPSLSSQTSLNIKFVYENDSEPYFENNKIDLYLYENQPIGTIIGQLFARDPDLGQEADLTYKLLNNNDLFELKPTGIFNQVYLLSKFIADYERGPKNYNLKLRAFSSGLFTDCSIQVYIKDLNDQTIQVDKSFKIVFNNYKNYFLTEQSARVPVHNIDEMSNLQFRLSDSIGKQLVNLDPKTGEITLKSILNSNNQINTSFVIEVTDGEQLVKTTCEMIVIMISDNLISESVTLNLFNIDMNVFLNLYYDNFISLILNSLPMNNFKRSNLHIFNIANSTNGLNLSMSISYDYERDKFMPSSILKQILYSNIDKIKSSLHITKLSIYEDSSCAIEPCLNFQQCLTNVKFSSASSSYINSKRIQFRPIMIKHDFSCSCPAGFTGTNISLTCDLEINLCYSNPCGQNGICISLESSYVCVCDPDYTGRMCEINLKTSKCCDSFSSSQMQQITNSTCLNPKYTNLELFSNDQEKSRVCKGGSICKNLILGGVLCDKCELDFYSNKFCELKSKHFPKNKTSYLILPGIKNRLRFKVKLSFSTLKTDSYLLFNGRIDRDKFSGLDFISFRVINSYLTFSYSLGDSFINELRIDNVKVSDGKWRTVTIEYKNRNLSISLDNDDLDQIDACELANNANRTSNDCIRVSNYYELPSKCLNQIETCFRYFDLNGPLILGSNLLKHPSEKILNFEGCISDLYINDKMIDFKEDVLLDYQTQNGCSLNKVINNQTESQLCSKSPCFNSGNCSIISTDANLDYKCSCYPGFKGKYCQYEPKISAKLLDNKANCPAKWWGKQPGICGPCKCDESKNFSPDCDKTNGQCQCKSKYYKKINKITKEEICVPCDCYLDGSNSLECEPVTGQCKCLPGAGITGRKCDQCVSPFAEMITKGSECRQLSTNECPKSFANNIWWPRTQFNSIANTSCPRGSIGNAYRKCTENGWVINPDLSECQSKIVLDSQLIKWSRELDTNKSQLNSYQAFKLLDDLNRLTLDAELSDGEEDDDYKLHGNEFNFISTNQNSLYANDLLTIKNLTKSIVKFDMQNAPAFLYIQDKHFFKNLFSVIDRLINKKNDLKLKQFEFKQNDFTDAEFQMSDLIIELDKYFKIILKHNQEYTPNDNLDLDLNNLKFHLKTLDTSDPYSDIIENSIRFNLFSNDKLLNPYKLLYSSINIGSNYLPKNLLLNQKQTLSTMSYRVVSNLFILNSDRKTNLIQIDFLLTNNYETVYDNKNNILNYKNLKSSKSDYTCVHLNKDIWSTKGAKLISYDPSTNMVKCSYETENGIYAVITPIGTFLTNSSSPINFSIVFNIFMIFTLIVLFFTLFTLTLLKKIQTSLTTVYTNITLNMFLMQFIFFIGVNSNDSQILCKFISILQHFFNLSSYLWMLILSLHLYRMLTELRDINKIGSSSPVFYYVISYLTPTIIVSLTLGIKQDIYTNYDSTLNFLNYPINKLDLSSVYCWLNINNFNDILFVYILPICVITIIFLILIILSYKEIKKNTFRQTDVKLVYQSLIGSLVLLPFNCLITIFLLFFLNTSTYLIQIESSIYQHLYILFSFLYSVLVYLIFVILNKQNKQHLKKVLKFLKLKLLCAKLNNEDEDDSLNISKSKLTTNQQFLGQYPTLKKNPNLNESEKIEVINVNKVNTKYMLDFNDFQAHTNSLSTTTTGGTVDDFESQNYLFSANNNNNKNAYLINTTNTDTTANESDYNYNYDFNRPCLINNTDSIDECDVVDVAQVLKTRNFNYEQQNDLQVSNTSNNFYKPKEAKYYNVNDNLSNEQIKTIQPAYWPNAIAECDSSFMEGSDMYTPAKLPFVRNNPSSINQNIIGNSPHSLSGGSSSNASKSSIILNPENMINIANYKIANISNLASMSTRQMNTSISQTGIKSPVNEDNETRV